MIKIAVIKAIDFYHNYLSLLKIPSCRYYPSCSQYTKEAVIKYGVPKGLLKGTYRIFRCNPFSKGGCDPV